MNTLMNNTKFVGSSSWANETRIQIEQVARHNSTVLITGPTGTGKEVLAQLIHEHSDRAQRPLLTVDCASLPAPLFESQLFGHKKGSFTGAASDSLGLFRAADGGTIFLDEIGELEPLQQAKLLRVLQTKTVVPVGSHKPQRVDVRVIAATNRDLEEEVREGRFRSDLFYRLNVVVMKTEALKNRPEDISELAQFFLDRFADDNGWPHKRLADDAARMLQAYEWPGNVRQLENMLERAALFSTDEIVRREAFPFLVDLFPEDSSAVGELQDAHGEDLNDDLNTDLQVSEAATASGHGQRARKARSITDEEWPTMEAVERDYLRQTLERTAFNQSAAARLTGLSRQSLLRRVQQLGIEMPSRQKRAKADVEVVGAV